MSDAAFRPARRARRGAVAGLGMAAVLAASLPVNLAFVMEPGEPGAASGFVDDVLRGGRTAEVTRLYNETFVLRDVGIEVFGLLSWTLFREGRPGVLVGDGDWLFSAEEFETDRGSAARVDAAVVRIAAVRDALAARGIDLVVALVPAKARIHGERLGGLRWPAEPAGRLARATDALSAAGVETVDLAPALASLARTTPAFLSTDTHWTTDGAGAAARAIAAAVGDVPGTEPGAWRLVPGEAVDHRGDLLRFVRLGPFADLLGPGPDRLVPLVAEGGGAGDLLGDVELPVALVGTSYSADPRWSFEAQLKAALGLDVLNMAEEGLGPFAPMDAFLASPVLDEAPPRVVVWEIPERYLDDPLPAPGAPS